MIWGYPHFWEPQYVNHPCPIFRSLTRLTLVECTWGSVDSSGVILQWHLGENLLCLYMGNFETWRHV